MEFYLYLPMTTIIVSFLGVVLCAVLNKKAAFITFVIDNIIAFALSLICFIYCFREGKSFRYSMGNYPAPFGNEIRFGSFETMMCSVLLLVLLMSVIGGKKYFTRDIEDKKINFFYALTCLIQVAFIALSYTNDIFTGYVFLEITALASTGLLLIKNTGRSTLAAVRYMIFNLLGSSLFLIGIVILYDMTGYLSMEYIMAKVTEIELNPDKMPIITIVSALMIIGLGIKAGLFPFHYWMPDTYGNATPASQSILSSVVSKGYLILIIKIIYRTIGIENIRATHILDIIFVLGILGMIVGSFSAISQNHINRMIALSSVAQMGYIYMGLGLGTNIGLVAAIFHMLCHAVTKPILFTSASRLIEISDFKKDFNSLKSSGYKDPLSGIAFSLGALSMVGFPFVSGFISKYLFAEAAFEVDKIRAIFVIIALIVSTLLNAVYYIHTMITIFTSQEGITRLKAKNHSVLYITSISVFMLLNVMMFFLSGKLIEIINSGIATLV